MLGLLSLFVFAFAAPPAPAVPAPTVTELDHLFEGFDATLVLYEQTSDQTWVYNPDKIQIGTLPCSTFKIPNTLIGLENGLLKHAGTVLQRDAAKYPEQDWWPQSWRVDQANLKDAFRASMVWFYCTLADRVSNVVIAEHLKNWKYPVPKDLTPGHYFWIEGNYGVSPVDQVAFLRRFYNDELGLKPETTATMKEIMLLEEGEGYRFSGKTGLCRLPDNTKVGWLIGFVEHKKGLYFYAMRLEADAYDKIMKHRVPLIRQLFKNLNLFS